MPLSLWNISHEIVPVVRADAVAIVLVFVSLFHVDVSAGEGKDAYITESVQALSEYAFGTPLRSI